MRKVMIISGSFPGRASSVAGIFVQEQARILAQRYDVAVLVPSVVGIRQAVAERVARRSTSEVFAGITVFQEREVARVPRSAASARRALIRAAVRGYERMRAEWGEPDIIHGHFALPGGWAAVRLGERYSVPVVFTEHSGPFNTLLGTASNRRMVREALSGADHVIGVSPSLMEEIRRFHDGFRGSVVGNVVRTDHFRPAKPQDRLATSSMRFLALGIMTAVKGFGDLIDAVTLLVESGVDGFKVRLGGDGPLRMPLEETVRARGLSRWIEFLGALDRDQVRGEMQECDAFVLASHHESFGIVQGEAMACGKPVIATRCGGPEFVVDAETGVLVDKANPVSLAGAMEDFIAGRVRFDSIRVRERVVERFGEDAFLENVTRVYEQVLPS